MACAPMGPVLRTTHSLLRYCDRKAGGRQLFPKLVNTPLSRGCKVPRVCHRDLCRHKSCRYRSRDKPAGHDKENRQTASIRRIDMPGMFRRIFVALAAAGWIAAGPSAAPAETKPLVTSLGPDFPKSEIFIGNSFFYYNNGMPSHVARLEKAADPDHKQDYRTTMVTISESGFTWHDV